MSYLAALHFCTWICIAATIVIHVTRALLSARAALGGLQGVLEMVYILDVLPDAVSF